MADMKALRVRIGLKANGNAAYPDFNSLLAVIASGMDWSYYVDRVGGGWGYDKVSGHDDDTPDSPRGGQWGVLLVPPEFADQAVAAFPAECSIVTESECETFWNDKVTAHLPEEGIDQKTMDSLSKQLEMLNDLDAAGMLTGRLNTRRAQLRNRIRKAVDPDDPEPGIRKNKDKLWTDFKAKKGITIVP